MGSSARLPRARSTPSHSLATGSRESRAFAEEFPNSQAQFRMMDGSDGVSGSVRVIRFGDCVFDLDARQLVRDGQPVHLSPKGFELLSALVGVRPRALSKAEL